MSDTRKKTEPQRLPYQTPRLRRYGSMRQLTAAGTGTRTEGTGGGTKTPDKIKI